MVTIFIFDGVTLQTSHIRISRRMSPINDRLKWGQVMLFINDNFKYITKIHLCATPLISSLGSSRLIFEQ